MHLSDNWAWQELEFAAYAIYGMPTYHGGAEWGAGNEDPKSFNPTHFDARQWMRIYKDAGMKHVILMVKHRVPARACCDQTARQNPAADRTDALQS
ncbi:alpha-L-fucosidase [Pirellulales bacterium]|nr:alpha-L-fucosidase [Pirellulales bacterium]